MAYNNHFTQLGAVTFDYPTAFDGDPAILQPTDNPNMEGGVYIAPGDYAKLLLMHLRGGRCDGGQVLSQAALDRMHADRIGPTYGASAAPGTGYGMGWWVDRASGRINDPGPTASVPWLDLEDGYGAYLVVETDTATGGRARPASCTTSSNGPSRAERARQPVRLHRDGRRHRAAPDEPPRRDAA